MKRADAEVEGLAEEETRSRRDLPRPNVDTTIPSLVEALSHTKVHEEDVKAVQNVALRPELWRYKGEGAAHLVLEFNDDAEEEREEHTTTDEVSLLKGHVLRVMKRQHTNSHSANSNNIPSHELHIPAEGLLWFQGKPLEVHNYELKEFAFIANVMAPLLGERFVHSGIPLQVNPEFLSTLSQRINGDRPDHRKKEADVDDTSTFAFILPDLSVFPRTNKLSAPSICVEIKPKWGFLPSSPLIRQGHSIKGRVCRYCMLQRYKLKTGKISEISAYCPLDLFSFDEKRVERALWDMLSVPQNNIKIFVDGTLRYTGSLARPFSLALSLSFLYVFFLFSLI
ncbi:Inositol-pentakisphosphate 2-kinase, variant 2 [Balamuthia mandrillaris]